MGKPKYSAELRTEIARAYLNGEGSYNFLAEKYDVSHKSVETWANKYREQGEDGFISNAGNKKYTAEFKTLCVEEVLNGHGSVDDVVAKYNISAREVLRSWIRRYNANKELRDYAPKREVYMAEARRKTTQAERKTIVEYCINHDKDYKNTASVFDVSYNQVYTWVKKYEASGIEGLADRRGKHKTGEEVDELERLRRENLRLKRQLEEKDMVVELLKKVKEFERM